MQIESLRKYLLVLFVFTIPNSILIHNISTGLLFLYWIIYDNKKDTYNIIFKNPIAFFLTALYFMHLISLLWSENIHFGLYVLKKDMHWLLLPIIMTLVKKEEIVFYIKVFIVAMTIDELISYSIKFGLISAKYSYYENSFDPVPFMSHVHYNPFLAFSIYLLLYFILRSKEKLWVKILSFVFVITMTINLFITGGRTGQVIFFILMIVLIFQFFKISWKSVLLIFIFLPIILYLPYKNSVIFNKRINMAVNNIINYKKKPNTSIGMRITYNINTLRLIEKNPIFGVGVGDYPEEYKKIHEKYNPNVSIVTVHPHNSYIYAWAQSGIFALLFFAGEILSMLILAIRRKDELSYIRLAFPILMGIIFFSDCYLFGHYTKEFYIFFAAILYKGFTWRDLRKS